MVKAPQVGRVKTRLAQQIGAVRAAWFYRHMAAAVMARLSASNAWETVLAVTPDAAAEHRYWRRGTRRVAQGGGDLGRRMQRAIHGQPLGPVVVIGTDIPAIRPSHIAAAFRALGGNDVVFGPASDGGYWLVGQKRRPRELSMFDNVRWSSPDALSDTVRNVNGLSVAFARELSDVDGAGDFRSVAAWCGRRILPVCGTEPAPSKKAVKNSRLFR